MNFKKKLTDAKRRSEAAPLSECIEELLNVYRLKSRYNQVNLIASWQKIMGNTIAVRTDKIYFKEDKLYVKLTSAPLKHQLTTASTKVVELINKEYGENFVSEVIFL